MWVFFWFALALVVGIFAASRGRSGIGWFFLSLLISPLLGGLFVAVLGNLKEKAATASSQPGPDTHVRCSACAEWVLPMATVCKHCGAVLQPDHAFESRRLLSIQKAKSDDMRDYLWGLGAVVVGVALFAALTRCSF